MFNFEFISCYFFPLYGLPESQGKSESRKIIRVQDSMGVDQQSAFNSRKIKSCATIQTILTFRSYYTGGLNTAARTEALEVAGVRYNRVVYFSLLT